MSESGGEKTEAPTAKRKRKAIDDGQILSSKDFGTALIVLLGCSWMMFFGPSLVRACKEVMVGSFTFGVADVEDFEPWRPIAEAGWKLATPMLALLLLAVIGAILSHAGLAGIRWNSKLFAPKASRINPASGLARIFGPNGWIELGKGLLKVVLLGSIGTWLLWSMTRRSLGLVEADLHGAIGAMGGEFLTLLFVMAGGLLLIAGVDLPIQILRHMAKLRMTKQEVRDEHKESEGSPEAKAAQRQRQRQILKGGFRKAVATANVVITNPTHFAVALRYEQGKDQVPVLVAKGRGATALAIRELAGELDVPILEIPQLARAVYYTSKENQEIRDDLYMAVATVLAFVFQLSKRANAVMPPVTVPDTALFDENGRKQARAH
ncbi:MULTISPECIES: flagellar type III secretion system protein FlhB [Sphingomonas]|uniref:Flagellar biosynthetic protein FlhB n=1 Tax=Sphingomonas kyeonggiensis TaxID=1268553 RepID=A0A7W7JZC3_9SPHN|nr:MULTISPECIES: flagellar type III secretion system protein FlhB [Sphingomonas]MBB4837838.1 flagellar biosynthetic protein FlhB [Sphingomonas kyeonggiensis]WHU01687.1 flagellar type III secretion system protein FlhB [Sphingomonas sp. NIBR02145]